jgi:uncharacterized protein YceK
MSATVAFWNKEKATWGKYYAAVDLPRHLNIL